MKRKLLLKSLLVAVGLLVGGNAWAQTETVTVLSEDYESYAAGDITATMQSKGWTFQSRNSKNEIKIIQGATDAANTTNYFDFYYPDGGASRNQSWNMGVSSSLEGSDNWTLTFSAVLNPGTNNSANVFYIVGTKSGKVTSANDAVTNPFIKLAGTAAAAVTYTPTVGTETYDNITLNNGTWYDFTVKATSIDATANTATLYVKIASGASTVLEKTIENFSTANIGTLYGICWNSPRGYSRLSLDNVLLTKEVDASICADPEYALTGANGEARKFKLTCETSSSTIYYAESELEKGATGWTEYTGEVTTNASTIYAYAVKGATTSNIISFSTGAGAAITLNAPSLFTTGLVSNGDNLNAVFDASYNADGVEFTPAATLSATFTPKGGTATVVTLPFTATERGTLTVTAVAEGFTSAEKSIQTYATYVQEWQSLDFSSIADDDVVTTLGTDWAKLSATGRWASWKDQTYTYYQNGEGNGSNVTINDRIRMRNVVLLNVGYGLGRNVTGGEAISVLNTTEGDIVAFKIYNGYGSHTADEANFTSYVLNTGANPSMSSTNGALLIQATVYVPVKYESMAIVGDFSANAWDPAQGIAMTRDADNINLWTLTIDEFVAEAKTYEYKATANGNWDDYVLPSGDNQEYVFSTAGKYTLTFTVNTKSHTLTLEAVPFHTYTVAGNNTDMFGFAWDTTNTDNDMTKNADGTYSITYTDVSLTEDVQFKVVQDHAWGNEWPSENYVIGIKMAGNYDVTINFDSSTGTVSDAVAIYKGISAAGYATYCTPYDLNFEGTGVTAYIAKLSGSEVSFEEVKNAPANEGLLLKAAEGTYKLPMELSSTDVTGNALVGVLVDTEVAAGSFVLLNGTPGVGFYKTKNAFTVGANTAYLPAQVAPAREFIGFGDDTTTGIDAMDNGKLTMDNVYNLNGQRVVAPAKGLYIVNGKKVILK